jgi:hypothetical protein
MSASKKIRETLLCSFKLARTVISNSSWKNTMWSAIVRNRQVHFKSTTGGKKQTKSSSE